MCDTLSDIGAIEVAVKLCSSPQLKREIFEIDVVKQSEPYNHKQQWDKRIARKALIIVNDLCLPVKLQEKVVGFVLLIGMRMLTWANYHEGMLELSREYSVKVFCSSFITQQGLIDTKKAAEKLMNDKNLNIEQKYKIAGIYCFTDHIPALMKELSEQKGVFYTLLPQWYEHNWSCYRLRACKASRRKRFQHRLKAAIKCGNKAAVQYCIEEIDRSRQNDIIVGTAVTAVDGKITRDYCIVRDEWFDNRNETWIPSDYYADMLLFLLSKLTEQQQMDFLKKDIERVEYARQINEKTKRATVIQCFLIFPFQNYFMKTAALMWDFLPEKEYTFLLFKICDKIEPLKENDVKCGEEIFYDYRLLLKKFWLVSPQRFKRYLFSNQEGIKAGLKLLIRLFTLKIFTYADAENIRLILATATDKEKEKIISSEEWRDVCVRLAKEEKLKMLCRFELNCFISKEVIDKSKREIIFTKNARSVCIDFVKNDNLNAAESFIQWSSLTEFEVICLKKEMIYSDDGKQACLDLIESNRGIKFVDRFIRWHCHSGAIEAFKKELIFSSIAISKFSDIILADQLDLVSNFANLCLSSEKDIKQLKKNIAHERGCSILEELIAGNTEADIYDEEGDIIGTTYEFLGDRWEEVEKFLTWCFSSEEEIDYKKNMFLLKSGVKIHFNLIKCNQWEQAEIFFAWLALSADDVKELKKKTLFEYEEAYAMVIELLYSEKNDVFPDYGSREEAIELLFRWYLTDRETVLKFKKSFENRYQTLNEDDENILDYFNSMILRRLEDLEKEKRGIKRKTKTCTPNKKFKFLM